MSIFKQIKNILGTKINPVAQESLATIKNQSDLLTFDSNNSSGNLNVRVEPVDIKIQNIGASYISSATEATLNLVDSQIRKISFDTNSQLQTTGAAPTLANEVNIKDTINANINPLTNEKIILLRRMTRLMESQQTVSNFYQDQNPPYAAYGHNIQKVIVDGFSGNIVTGTGISGDGVPVVTMASDYPTAITGVNVATSYVGWNNNMFRDVARNAYAKSIRKNLIFS